MQGLPTSVLDKSHQADGSYTLNDMLGSVERRQ